MEEDELRAHAERSSAGSHGARLGRGQSSGRHSIASARSAAGAWCGESSIR